MPAGRLNLRLYFSPVITLAPDGAARDRPLAPDRADRRERRLGRLARHHPRGRIPQDARRLADRLHRALPAFRRALRRRLAHDADTLAARALSLHARPGRHAAARPRRRHAAHPRRARPRSHAAARAKHARRTCSTPTATTSTAACTTISPTCSRPTRSIDVAGQGTWRGPEGVRRYLARFGAPGPRRRRAQRPAAADAAGEHLGRRLAGADPRGRARHDRPARRRGLLVGGYPETCCSAAARRTMAHRLLHSAR